MGRVVGDRRREAFTGGLAAWSGRNAQNLSVIKKIAVFPARPGKFGPELRSGKELLCSGNLRRQPQWPSTARYSDRCTLDRNKVIGWRSMNHL
jgi:hypothetical protein